VVLKEETERDKDYEGELPKGQFFFIAYTLDGVEDPADRPITFSFNGGPGSSSVWLHLGLLGPRRVVMTDEGDLPKPPYRLTDNEFSLLDKTDLVFIDPIGTGYSRPADGEQAKQFHGFKKDIESVGDFIRLYTTRYNRWLSPKFLIGESYGTTRASGLSGYLQERHGMYMNGIMLVSTVLDFGTIDFNPGNELPYVLFLPSYTATAWYHNAIETAVRWKSCCQKYRNLRSGNMRRRCCAAMGCRKASAAPSSRSWRATPVSRRNTWSEPTCACPITASSKSCCAGAGARWVASTAASWASIRIRWAKAPTTIPPSPISSDPIPPGCTIMCAAS
jgi:carboxypeptidase C (cathepsin A)